MKRRILAICCLALFLLYTCTALADQQVRLEQYGVSFTVPDGMTWVPYQEASADIQAVRVGFTTEIERKQICNR